MANGSGAGTPQRLAVPSDRFGLVLGVDVARQLVEIEVGQEAAPLPALVTLPPEGPDLDDSLTPEPHLADAEPAVDLQLVDPPGCPHDLDGKVGSGRASHAQRVALVRLEGPRSCGVPERPGPEAIEGDPLFLGIGFQETGDGLLDALVIDRRAHQLERSVEVGEPDPGTVTADLENELEVGPAHVVEGHALVFGSGGSGRSGEGDRKSVV